MNLEELKQQYNSFKPREEWVRQTRKDLKSQFPGPNWHAYGSGMVVLFLFTFGLVAVGGPEQSFRIVDHQIKVSEKQKEKMTIVKQVQKIQKTAENINREIRQVLAVKTNVSSNDGLDPLSQLKADLARVEVAQEVLNKIEDYLKNGDYVLARQELDILLKNSIIEGLDSDESKVEGSKENNNN